MAGSLDTRQTEEDIVEQHEINVTPFIDVMLVLLIIFMVAAPLATVDIPVDLPKSAATPQPRPDKPLYVTVQKDLIVMVGEEEVAHADLKAALDVATQGDEEARIYLRADQGLAYGELMTVMNLLRIAGYSQIALVGLEASASALEAVPAETAE